MKYNIEEIIKMFGYKNIILTDKPVFDWDGSNIVDESDSTKTIIAGSIQLLNTSLYEILYEYRNYKVVIVHKNGDIFHMDSNTIRIYVDMNQ